MQAIITKYLGPTNSRGSRIKATCAAGSVTVQWAYELGIEDNHHRAAVALRDKLEWPGELAIGELYTGKYVHVFVEGKA